MPVPGGSGGGLGHHIFLIKSRPTVCCVVRGVVWVFRQAASAGGLAWLSPTTIRKTCPIGYYVELKSQVAGTAIFRKIADADTWHDSGRGGWQIRTEGRYVVRSPCQEGEKEPRVNDLLVLTFFRRHRYHELSWSLVAPLGPVCSCRFA